MHGRALAEGGRLEDGIEQIEEGISARKAIGVGVALPFELALMAEAYCMANQIEAGQSVLTEALDFANDTGEGFHLPEIHRLRGELLLRQGATEAAISCFGQCLDEARRQQAKSLELRVVTSLARLWRDGSERAEARDLVAPVYGRFSEGFDTADLKEAKALLDELS